jgi:uncharacterized protein (DUF58 family)
MQSSKQKKWMVFFSNRWYYLLLAIAGICIVAYFSNFLLLLAQILLGILMLLTLVDYIILFAANNRIAATRNIADRLSLGDENTVQITIENAYNFLLQVIVTDDVPFQLQQGSKQYKTAIAANNSAIVKYILIPTQRGSFTFGNINILIQSPLQLIVRHIQIAQIKDVAVYPSYMQMKKYYLMAVTNQLQSTGQRMIRKMGSSTEFEQIKEYVFGDDYRKINWQATARKQNLMVNTFIDEKSQPVICIIDKSRSMKMPFDGLTLLDYAINASLVLSNIVLYKQDKAGLITFNKKVDTVVYADKKPTQIGLLVENLYKQETAFTESSFDNLYATIRYKIKQRSLLILFTNFESMFALERQMPYLKQMAAYHTLVVVFFFNTAINALVQSNANTIEEIYSQTIAEQFVYEKRQMVKALQQLGIIALLTTPQQLTVNTLNKYMEIKRRQLLG